MKALTEALLYKNTANARLVGRNALKPCPNIQTCLLSQSETYKTMTDLQSPDVTTGIFIYTHGGINTCIMIRMEISVII